jgi:pimeloyl-ACP methyl ester carboxylesterase
MQSLQSSGYAPVNGLQMYYEVHGNGNMPLVLIHGGGSTIESTFSRLIPLLSARHKIIAVELQAHGRTTDRNTPESFEQDADDVAGLLKYLNITKANILGFSNGGTTTLQIAIRHAELLNRIIVVSSNYQRAGMMEGFFDGMQHASLDNMPSQLKEAFLKVTPDQARLQNMFEKDKERMLNFRDMEDDQLRSIKTPSLLMVADKDVITVEHMLKMSHLITDAKLAVLPGTHGSIIGEVGYDEYSNMPAISAMLIEEFLKS